LNNPGWKLFNALSPGALESFARRFAKPTLAWGILGLGLLGVVGIGIYMLAVRRLNPLRVEIASVSRKDGEAMSYIVTYLLPFLDATSGSAEKGIGLAIFFFVLGVLYINSNMIHINPMLNMFGYHIYEIELSNGDTYSLISKSNVRRGKNLPTVKMSNDVLLEVKQ
jgi:hypothetical protein